MGLVEATQFRAIYVGSNAGVAPVWLPDGSVLVGGSGTFAPNIYVVNTQTGDNGNDGRTLSTPFETMAKAFSVVVSNDIIILIGSVFEQLTAPLGVYGVRIIGGVGGTLHYGTEGGVALPGFGAFWTYPASGSTNAPLLTLREKGWELHNFMMVPKNGYAAVRANNSQNATYPDSSSFRLANMVFNGPNGYSGYQGIGVEDYDSNGLVQILDSEFYDLEYAIKTTPNQGIAFPTRWKVKRNIFRGNKNDIYTNARGWQIEGNDFCDVYHATDHPNTLNLAATQDSSGANRVRDNFFADTSGNVTIAKGYKPATGDDWCNHVAGTAAYIAAVPS